MVATNPTIKGVWQPLSLILYGSVIHPLSSASRRDTRFSGRTRLSTTTSGSVDSNPTHRDVATLEVGDEVYPFEKYTPKGKEVEGAWYRGFVKALTVLNVSLRAFLSGILYALPGERKAPSALPVIPRRRRRIQQKLRNRNMLWLAFSQRLTFIFEMSLWMLKHAFPISSNLTVPLFK